MRIGHLLAAGVVAGALLICVNPVEARKKKDEKEYSADDINRRITASLEWFVDHQGEAGNWSFKQFSEHSQRPRAKKTHNLEWVNPGEPEGDAGKHENQDVAATAFVLLCFVGSGHDHTSGPYSEYVKKGLGYLLKQQRDDGCFGDPSRASMAHDHAVATMALSELYGVSADNDLKVPTESAVVWLLNAQNDNAGWRYGVKPGESDTQLTGWCLLALKSAQLCGIKADYETAFESAGKYFESVTGEKDGKMRTGYMFPGDGSPRTMGAQSFKQTPDMDAVHVVCRLFSGNEDWSVKNKDLKEQAELFTDNLPEWKENTVDLPYWYFATLALYQFGDKEWKKWEEALLTALMENQRGWREEDKDSFEAVLDEHGSWDAVGAWHPLGGRVWSTAASTLMLQVIARYKRLED